MADLTGIGSGLSAIADIVGKFFPDKTQAEKDQLTMALAQLNAQQQDLQMQADVNKAEATNQNMFVAGWRPFVGWICGAGFGVTILGPLLTWISGLCGHPVQFPAMDTESLMTILFGMLGLGGMRTVEKVSGVKGVGH